MLVGFAIVAGALVMLSGGWPSSTGVGGRIDGPLLVAGGEQPTQFAALVGGPLTVVDDCLLVGNHPTIWPPGTTWDDGRVRLADGRTFALGATVTGGGGWVDASAIGGMFSSTLAAVAGRCSPDGEVRVLQTVLPEDGS